MSKDTPKEVICPLCLCHYIEGHNHICPPWMKFLVSYNKKKNKIC